MQSLLITAAIIAIIVGIAHSVLGEILIFRKLRTSGFVPTNPAPPLQSRHVRIIWATWHATSVFGWAFAGILFALAQDSSSIKSLVWYPTIFAFTGGAILVLIGTRGRHPGWLGLLAVAVLVFLSNTS